MIKLRFKYWLILLSFFLCFANYAFSSNKYKFELKKASDYLNNGEYLEALGIYQNIFNGTKNYDVKAKSLYLIGNTYGLYLNQPKDALDAFNHILNKYPNSTVYEDVMFNKGVFLYENHDYKKAYTTFLYYLKKYPQGKRKQSAIVWADSAMLRLMDKRASDNISLPDLFDSIIRVLLLENKKEVRISSNTNLYVSNNLSDEKYYYGPGPIKITAYGDDLFLNNIRLNFDQCNITSDGNTIQVDKKQYRGHLAISKEEIGLNVINYLPIEEYLYGVIPKEMPASWPKEALMAQTIASRTYVLNIKKKTADKPYDVRSTVLSQVYGGYDAEYENTNKIVNETAGKVMVYNGNLILAYYHSNSGGYTEDAKNVWLADIPYLKSTKDDFSKKCPTQKWKYLISYYNIKKKLRKNGININKILAIRPKNKTLSGRVKNIEVITDKKNLLMTSHDFRMKVGNTLLKSTLFNMKKDNYHILFTGKGYGHGVGMSQWGAKIMAQDGFGHDQILKKYYKGVKIKKF